MAGTYWAGGWQDDPLLLGTRDRCGARPAVSGGGCYHCDQPSVRPTPSFTNGARKCRSPTIYTPPSLQHTPRVPFLLPPTLPPPVPRREQQGLLARRPTPASSDTTTHRSDNSASSGLRKPTPAYHNVDRIHSPFRSRREPPRHPHAFLPRPRSHRSLPLPLRHLRLQPLLLSSRCDPRALVRGHLGLLVDNPRRSPPAMHDCPGSL